MLYSLVFGAIAEVPFPVRSALVGAVIYAPRLRPVRANAAVGHPDFTLPMATTNAYELNCREPYVHLASCWPADPITPNRMINGSPDRCVETTATAFYVRKQVVEWRRGHQSSMALSEGALTCDWFGNATGLWQGPEVTCRCCGVARKVDGRRALAEGDRTGSEQPFEALAPTA